WRRGLAGFANLTLQRPSAVSVKSTARHFEESALLLGLLVTPAVLLAGPARLLTRARARATWATLVVCLATGALVVRDFLAPGASAVFLAPKMVLLNQWTLTGAHPDLVPELLLKS